MQEYHTNKRMVPVLAAATVLSGFLFFAGLGSAAVSRFGAERPQRTAWKAIGGVCVCGLLALLGARLGPTLLASAPLALRLTTAMGLIAPLAFAMGMPFPLGLEALRRQSPEMIPWAWGVNGCASVVSPVLAMLMAIHLGFTAVILIALVLYGATAAVFPRCASG